MLHLQSFTFNAFLENTYVLYDDSKEAIIFDPGCFDNDEKHTLTSFILAEGLKVTKLINTHCHIDHVLGNAFVKRQYDVPLLVHKQELPVLKSVSVYASNYGFPGYEPTLPDGFLEENQIITIGSHELTCLFVPGHSPGHLVIYNEEHKICIAGDTLFQDSIGRTDLPGGDHQTLLSHIKKVLFSLPDDTQVFPGHGGATTIGYEKTYNPFVGKQARF